VFSEDKKKKTDNQKIREAALVEAADEVIQRYGSAAKEHFVAYSGIDNETGKQLTKSLKSIADSKINPDYKNQNIKQQAGFSAEIKTTANRNAENIINRNSARTSRTDDIGAVNDQLYDLVNLDAKGNIIKGSESQMKFVGSSPDMLLKKLTSSKFEKYLNADALFDIADDDYDALIGVNGETGIIDQKIQALEKQVIDLQKKGEADAVARKQTQIDKYQKIKSNLRKTGMTRKEAIEARLHPELSTVKATGKIAHRAGVEQAKVGAAISGSVSLVKNVVLCACGEITPEEAAESVIIDTGTGLAVSYTTAFSGTIIKGFMENSRFALVRNIANTNLPSRLVITTINIGKTMHKYFEGEIDGAECVEQLGREGFAEIGSAMFAVIGSSLGGTSAAVTLLGGLAGAALGYVAATAVYAELSLALKEAKLARERRILIEKECDEAVKLILQYRREMQEQVGQYFTEHIETFNLGFSEMDRAICENDINGFIKGNNEIQRLLGHDVQFENQDEFDALMASDIAFKL